MSAPRLTAALVGVAGVLVAAVVALWQANHNAETAQRAFDAVAGHVVEDLQNRLQRYDAGLRGLRGAVMASGQRAIRRAQVRAYADSRDLDREFPGARGFGVIWRVPVADEAAFVAAARADGWPAFALRQLGVNDGERKVITFVEPVERNRQAVGLDVASEAMRNAAAVESMRSGRTTLTAPITLVQAAGLEQRSFLLMLPIYRPGAALTSAAEREAATLGWTYAPLIVDEVLAGLDGGDRQYSFALYDLPADAGEPPRRLFGTEAASPAQARLPSARVRFAAHGRQWEARLTATPAFVAGLNQNDPRHIAFGLCGVAVLLAVIAFLLTHGKARTLRERLETSRRAAIVEGSEDAIIGATLGGVVTEWNAGAQRLFGYTAAQALGRTVEDLLLPDDRLAEDERLRSTIAGGRRVPPFDTVRRHRDGELIAVSLTAGPILDAQGRCVGMAKTIRDMREAHRARAELAALNAGLEQQVAERTAALQTALRDNAALLQTLHRFAIVSVADRAGTITEVNDGFCAISGYPAEELVGQNHRILNSGTHDAAFWRGLWRRLARGEHWRGEICNRAKDGSLYWVDSIIAPFLDAHGRIEKYISIRTDITPLKRLQQEAEAARLAAEEASRFLQAVTDRLPLRIAYLDREHRFRFVNEAQCEAYGLARADLLGRQPRLFVDGEPPAALAGAFAAVLQGQAQQYETEERYPGSAAADFEVRLVPDRLGDGRIAGYYAVASDISVRKRAENELRRTLTTLRTVLDSATQVSILAVDNAGRVNLFNRGAERLTGLSAAEVIGRDVVEVLHDPQELAQRRQALAERLGRPVGKHRVFVDASVLDEPSDWLYRRKDGGTVPVSLAVTSIRDDAGQLVGHLGIAYDISARREFEQSLREAMHRANHANRAKSQFLANMSHEIRTPMNAVIGLSYLLERTRLDGDQSGFVAKIKLAGKSLLSIINDVLDLSKIEAAEMQLEAAPFSLHALLREIGELMGVQAESKGIAFEIERAADLPGTLVGDATRLRQVLVNLLSNAIKFTGRGSVRLAVQALVDEGGSAARLRFAVRDTGIGIAAEAMERLFQPFAQADTSTTRRYGGTGLGLSIVKQLVELMGGSVRVASVPNVGSEFVVELELPLGEAWSLPEVVVGRTDGPALPGLRVLVVDDSDLNLEVARRILELEGAVVSMAENGQQAVDRLIATPDAFDIVLMDVQMPVLDGHDATRRLRSALGLATLPVIALTAGVTVGEQQRAADAGMNDVLGKPFDPQALVACILRQVGPLDPAAVAMPSLPAPAGGDWPRIDGLDTGDARRRLGGDLVLFGTLLKRLLNDFADLGPASSLHPASLAALARRMHNLKGSAGTLGAKAIERSAAQTEAACADRDLVRVGHLLPLLTGQLQALRRAAEDLLVEPVDDTPPGADASTPLDGPLLAELLQQLAGSDLAALQRFAELAPALRQRLGRDAYAALRAQMDNLQFDEVARGLRALADTEVALPAEA